MEVSALKHQQFVLRGPAPLLRLASDEQLVALIRRGQHSAFEALVARYQSRLIAFCRHMLRSQEDAEDVLQEVFAASFNALLADQREINVRPWLYRIARNRCLNHMRRTTAIGIDTMDVWFADHGQSTFEKVTHREDFRLLLADIAQLPETQRTAIVLREMDALSYEQIAEAMETTVPGVKSLLVRARVSLAEAAEARKLTCEEVRLELAAIAEGLASISAPFRRHVKRCERCGAFRKQLRANNRAMAIALPVGPLVLFKKALLTKVGVSFGGHGAGATGAGAGVAASAGAGVAGSGAAGALTAGALGTKAVAGLAAAALVTAGAVEVHHGTPRRSDLAPTRLATLPSPHAAPAIVASEPQPASTARHIKRLVADARTPPIKHPAPAAPKPTASAAPKLAPETAVAPQPVRAAPTTQQLSGTAVLPPEPPTTRPTSAPLAPANRAPAAPTSTTAPATTTAPAPAPPQGPAPAPAATPPTPTPATPTPPAPPTNSGPGSPTGP